MLKSINQATRTYAHRLLQCLTVAIRPLRLEELAEVLAFDFDDAPGGIPRLNQDWQRQDREQAVLSTCSSLIAVVADGDSRVVQFSHFSVKEFLISDRLAAAVVDLSFHHIALEPAHTVMTQACLSVLLQLDGSTQKTSPYPGRFPLARYAGKHWVDHAKFERASLHVKDGMEKLFDTDKPYFSRWIDMYDMDDIIWGLDEYDIIPERLDAAPVYYAALCGLCDIVEKLITENPEQVDARGGAIGTALHAMARKSHVKVGQVLLRHGADLNAPGRWQQTPLHLASLLGHLEIVQWLLIHGANVNATDDMQWTPLHGATLHGHFEVVRTLLRYKPDLDAQNKIGQTPLHVASSQGQVNILRLLLDHGADAMVCAIDQSTPLLLASACGKLEVVHILLEHGVDIDAEDGMGITPYQIALRKEYDDIAQLLLAHGVKSTT